MCFKTTGDSWYVLLRLGCPGEDLSVSINTSPPLFFALEHPECKFKNLKRPEFACSDGQGGRTALMNALLY